MTDEKSLLILFESEDVITAKDNEVEIWKKNGVYEEVENTGQTTVTARLVVQIK